MGKVVNMPKPARVPPSDLDAEAAVLSAAMLEPDTIPVARAILQPPHFYSDANGRIFGAILQLAASGKSTDVVMVSGLLRDTGRLDQVGGTPYLAQIVDATPAVANVATHAQRVFEKWRVRQLVSICHKVAAEGYGDFGDVQAFIDNATASLRAIAESSAVKTTVEFLNSEQIFAPLSEPEFVVDQVVRCASVTEIVGYGGGSKTWTAVAMIAAIGAGKPWLGRFPTKQGRVAYLDYENGSYEMRRRLKAVASSMGLDRIEGVSLAAMPSVYMSDGPAFEKAMLQIAKTHSLIVIDTLKAASPGVDENDSNMRSAIDAARRVAESTGCAFVVLVHAKKVSGSVTTIDPREAGRGSSAIFDAADSVLHITYNEGKPLRVAQTKARLGKLIDPFEITITDGQNGAVLVQASDIETDEQSTAAASAQARARFEALCDRVLEAVRSSPGATGRLIRQLVSGARSESIIAALEHLEQHGAVRNAGNSKGAKWFPMPGRTTHPKDEWEGVGEDV
ncbi:MAG: AAA family ATPase [Polyangiaceae bacterium]